jgi:DNA-directed RNA polymerase subunit M/transcription elongation factor TFIIS
VSYRAGRDLWPRPATEAKVNPIWAKVIVDAVRNTIKKCPHCKKKASYAKKQPGHFYTCKGCGHRFKEKGQ